VLRYLPALLSLALTIYCLLDAIQTESADIRNLPKVGWLVVILFVPLVGPAAWLIAGRPKDGPRATPPQRRPQGPDDDPDFLKGL
jgi:hypothetical protein